MHPSIHCTTLGIFYVVTLIHSYELFFPGIKTLYGGLRGRSMVSLTYHALIANPDEGQIAELLLLSSGTRSQLIRHREQTMCNRLDTDGQWVPSINPHCQLCWLGLKGRAVHVHLKCHSLPIPQIKECLINKTASYRWPVSLYAHVLKQES